MYLKSHRYFSLKKVCDKNESKKTKTEVKLILKKKKLMINMDLVLLHFLKGITYHPNSSSQVL